MSDRSSNRKKSKVGIGAEPGPRRPPDSGGAPGTSGKQDQRRPPGNAGAPGKRGNRAPKRPPDSGGSSETGGKQGLIRRLVAVLGPGLITGASDDDPSGIGTYAAAGASLGFATLWTAIVTLPLMIVVQHICAKIGMVSGMGLAAVLRKHYPRWVVISAISL